MAVVISRGKEILSILGAVRSVAETPTRAAGHPRSSRGSAAGQIPDSVGGDSCCHLRLIRPTGSATGP